MKKFIVGLISTAVGVGLLLLLPQLIEVWLWLKKIDNADFGIPLWLDIFISIFSGCLVYTFIGTVTDFIDFYNSDLMSIGKNAISIMISFVLGFAVHIFLKYWYIICAIIILLIVVIVLSIIKNKKSEKEE